MNKFPENIALFTPSGCLREETILGYIKEELPGEAVRKVEMHLADCPLCSDAVEGYMEMSAGTDVHTVLEKTKAELFKGKDAGQLRVVTGSPSEKKRPNRLLYLSLAASLALLISAYFVIRFLVNEPAQQQKMLALNEPEKTGSKKTTIENESTTVENRKTESETEKTAIEDKKAESETKKTASLKSEEKIQPASGASATGKSGGTYKSLEAEGPGYMAWSSTNQKQEAFRDANKTPVTDSLKAKAYSVIVDAALADYEMVPVQNNTEVQTVTGGDLKKRDLAEEKREITKATDEVSYKDADVSGKPSRGNNIGTKRSKNKEADRPMAAVAQNVVTVQEPVARKDMNDGVTEYDKGNYHEAVDRFEQVLSKEPEDQQALYYSGMSYYYNHQNDKALEYLNKVLKNKAGTYYQAAQWQVAKIYLETSQVKQARKVLNEIIDGNGTYKQNAVHEVDILDK